MTSFDFQNPYINPKIRQTMQKKNNSSFMAAVNEKSPLREKEPVTELQSIEVDLTSLPKELSPKHEEKDKFASENIAETVG